MKELFLINIASVIIAQIVRAPVVLDDDGPIVNNSKYSEKCPPFMDHFPVHENSTELICDCSFASFIYFEETKSCYQVYKKGPCLSGNYLVLPRGEDVAKCEKNPCEKDGLVPFNYSCAPLFVRGPHCYLDGYLNVNPQNFEIICTFQKIQNIVNAPSKSCPPGSRRNSLSVCKKAIQ